MVRSLTLALFLVSFLAFTSTAKALMTIHTLESPNKEFKLVLAFGPMNDVYCTVFHKGKMLFQISNPVFELADDDYLPATAKYSLRITDDEGKPALKPSRFRPNSSGPGQVKSIRDMDGSADYDEMSVTYRKTKEGKSVGMGDRYNPDDYEDLVKIVFRAYNGGIAYRYEIATKRNDTFTIKNEVIEFDFPDDYSCWANYSKQQSATPEKTSLSKIKKDLGCKSLQIELPDGLAISFGELSHFGFAAMAFQPGAERTGTFSNLFDGQGTIDRTGKRTAVVVKLDGDTVIQGTGGIYRTPWRFFTTSDAKESGGMLESLNTPERFRF